MIGLAMSMAIFVNSLSASVALWASAFTDVRELLRLGEQLRLLLAAGGRDLLAERLLLGAQSLGCDDGGPAPHVGVEGGVDELDGVAARCLRRPDSFRILAEQLGVNHRSSLFGRIPRNTRA